MKTKQTQKTSPAIAEAVDNAHYGARGWEAIGAFFSNYINFKGRSDRREYWWWTLWASLAQVAVEMLIGHYFITANLLSNQFGAGDPAVTHNFMNVLFLMGIYYLWCLAIFLPSLTLTVRRFRDAGIHWGWLIGLTAVSAVAGLRLFTKILASDSFSSWTGGDAILWLLIMAGCGIARLVIVLLKSRPIKLASGQQVDNRGHDLLVFKPVTKHAQSADNKRKTAVTLGQQKASKEPDPDSSDCD